MHDILVKNDCDSSFQGIHYISVNRNNIRLFAVGFCTSMPTDLCACYVFHYISCVCTSIVLTQQRTESSGGLSKNTVSKGFILCLETLLLLKLLPAAFQPY